MEIMTKTFTCAYTYVTSYTIFNLPEQLLSVQHLYDDRANLIVTVYVGNLIFFHWFLASVVPPLSHSSMPGSPTTSSPISGAAPEGHGFGARAGGHSNHPSSAVRSSSRFGKGFRKWLNLQLETGKTQVLCSTRMHWQKHFRTTVRWFQA